MNINDASWNWNRAGDTHNFVGVKSVIAIFQLVCPSNLANPLSAPSPNHSPHDRRSLALAFNKGPFLFFFC
jgi:hypothetical protein